MTGAHGVQGAGGDHGSDEDVDCSAVLYRIYEYLDGEMTPDDCSRIANHLEECGPCLAEHDLDRQLKALIKRSCACEPAPTQLRAQIIRRITTIQTDFGD